MQNANRSPAFSRIGGPMQFQDKPKADLALISSYLPHPTLLFALDASKVGVVICDRRLRYKALNQTIAEIHNVPIKAHLGNSFREVLGGFGEELVPHWEAVFATGHPLTNLEVSGRLPKRPGVGRWINSLYPLLDGGGRVTKVCSFVVEVTPPPVPSPQHSSPTGRASSMTVNQSSGQDRRQGKLLSHREQEVLRLLADGNSNKEISSVLAISVRTVETYRSRLMIKLDANSIVDLVRYAVRNHIATL